MARSSKSAKLTEIEIPFLLKEAVKGGRAIVFLGAGASKECKNEKGWSPPDANQLRDMLASTYFGKLMPNRSVMTVAEMAIENGAGRSLVFDSVARALEGFETSEAHRALTDFRWRAIATTNYDLFVEDAYADVKRRRQVLIPFVKDDEPVDARKGAFTNPLEYIKLHGCVNHRLDKEAPLVLSWEQYEHHLDNRKHLYERISYLSHQCPMVFIGYGIADAHIRSLIYRMESNSRPRWYVIDPSAEIEDVNFWNGKNVEIIKCRFGEFMASLSAAISPLERFIAPSANTVDFPLRSHYAVEESHESDQLHAYLERDIALIHAAIDFPEQTAERFYSGYDTGWGGIIQNFDVKRKITADLLFAALLEHEKPLGPVFLLLRGPAGAGKTIALKRAAFDAATQNRAVVLWLEQNRYLRPEMIAEIHELTKQTVYLFVDQIAIHAEQIKFLLNYLKSRSIPLVLIGAEREADWSTYCHDLEEIHPPQFFRVGRLSSNEVEGLLDLLEKHDCLGELKGRERSKQIEAFMNEEKANRQLLVALHELTRGYPFERIVLEEYEKVPERARNLYLDIATMHQYAVPVRAGTISRISGVYFEDYAKQFLQPLKDMVIVDEDDYGDYFYRTRHPSIASMLFDQVCDNDERRSQQIVRLIEGFQVAFSTDRRTLEGVCKGRVLAQQFSNPDWARDIFAAALDAAPSQAYLRQQWAIFEYTHPQGDLEDAERLAEEAAEKEPKSSSFIHTRAEVARRRANSVASPVMKEQLRRQSRKFLDSMPKQDRFNLSTRCKLLVDEVADLSDELSDFERSAEDRFFAEKLRDAELAIARAQQAHPEDPGMVEIEARLWNLLKEKDRALRALERAWKKVPRGSGTAIRIGRIYATAGNAEAERNILDQALTRDPEDKSAHFAMAKHLLAEGPEWDKPAIRRHLAASFKINDASFEERYILAGFLYAIGDVTQAVEMFAEISIRAPKDFRRFAPRVDDSITKHLPNLSGTVEAAKDGYFFIRSGSYPNPVFAHHSAFEEVEIAQVEVGQRVYFKVRFNYRGPVAVSVHLKPSDWNRTTLEIRDANLMEETGS